MRRILTTVAAAAVVALTAAGCGGDGTTETGGNALPVGGPTTPAAAATTPTTPEATGSTGPIRATNPGAPEASPVSTRCHTSELAASFAAGDAAAGNRYARLVLTNTARRTCTVFGYGGLQPLDAGGKELPITLTRNTQQGPPKLVRLAPGATVARTIHWTVVPSGDGRCPTPATVSIIPPDETDPLTARWTLGQVCNGVIDGYPFGVTL